jgi:hypothetical protein
LGLQNNVFLFLPQVLVTEQLTHTKVQLAAARKKLERREGRQDKKIMEVLQGGGFRGREVLYGCYVCSIGNTSNVCVAHDGVLQYNREGLYDKIGSDRIH